MEPSFADHAAVTSSAEESSTMNANFAANATAELSSRESSNVVNSTFEAHASTGLYSAHSLDTAGPNSAENTTTGPSTGESTGAFADIDPAGPSVGESKYVMNPVFDTHATAGPDSGESANDGPRPNFAPGRQQWPGESNLEFNQQPAGRYPRSHSHDSYYEFKTVTQEAWLTYQANRQSSSGSVTREMCASPPSSEAMSRLSRKRSPRREQPREKLTPVPHARVEDVPAEYPTDVENPTLLPMQPSPERSTAPAPRTLPEQGRDTILFTPVLPAKTLGVSNLQVGRATNHLRDIFIVRANPYRNIVAIETANPATKAALLSIRQLCGIPVSAFLARGHNNTRGIVKGINIRGDASTLIANIRSDIPILQGTRHGQSLYLTFNGPVIPEFIHLCNVRLAVHAIVPSQSGRRQEAPSYQGCAEEEHTEPSRISGFLPDTSSHGENALREAFQPQVNRFQEPAQAGAEPPAPQQSFAEDMQNGPALSQETSDASPNAIGRIYTPVFAEAVCSFYNAYHTVAEAVRNDPATSSASSNAADPSRTNVLVDNSHNRAFAEQVYSYAYALAAHLYGYSGLTGPADKYANPLTDPACSFNAPTEPVYSLESANQTFGEDSMQNGLAVGPENQTFGEDSVQNDLEISPANQTFGEDSTQNGLAISTATSYESPNATDPSQAGFTEETYSFYNAHQATTKAMESEPPFKQATSSGSPNTVDPGNANVLTEAVYNIQDANETFAEEATQNDPAHGFAPSDDSQNTFDTSNANAFAEGTYSSYSAPPATANTMQNGSNLTPGTSSASSNALNPRHISTFAEAIHSLQNAFNIVYGSSFHPNPY